MISQESQSQQFQSKTLKCKKCNKEVPNSKLYEHLEICQKQYLNDQPNSTQVHENSKSIMIDKENKLNESSSTSTFISQEDQLQSNQVQTQSQNIGFKMLKLCDICQQYFQVEIYYNHQKECQKNHENQDKLNMSTVIFLNSQEISQNNQITNEVQDEVDQEIVQSDYTVRGTYRRTIITKDKQTGFTNYKTTYGKKQNKILDNQNKSKPNEEIITNDETINQSSQKEQHFLDQDNSITPQPDDEPICSICNRQYESLDQTKLFESCQHLFHLTCIQNEQCPICAAKPIQQQ